MTILNTNQKKLSETQQAALKKSVLGAKANWAAKAQTEQTPAPELTFAYPVVVTHTDEGVFVLYHVFWAHGDMCNLFLRAPAFTFLNRYRWDQTANTTQADQDLLKLGGK